MAVTDTAAAAAECVVSSRPGGGGAGAAAPAPQAHVEAHYASIPEQGHYRGQRQAPSDSAHLLEQQ